MPPAPRHYAALAAAILAAACSDSPTTPPPQPPVTVAVTGVVGTIYEGDVATLRATVRDASGAEIPGATVTWSSNDPTIAEVASNGVTTALRNGTARISATHGSASGSIQLAVLRLAVQQVTIVSSPLLLARGDITPIGVRVRGEGGRDVRGRLVTLASDDPAIATIDASGRVRAVSAGVTTIRATADGVTGTGRVEVQAHDATFNLARLGGERVPVLVASDSVTWDGVRELHQVFIEGGTLRLTGSSQPRYVLHVAYSEYNVRTVDGRQVYEPRLRWREDDRGIVAFDARGDLAMTSELISPLAHTASAVSGGVQLNFRVPGSDDVLPLFYRREPE